MTTTKILRDYLIETMIQHAEAHIRKHKANVEIYLQNPAGIPLNDEDSPDVIETIERELDEVARYEDQLEVLKKHFVGHFEE